MKNYQISEAFDSLKELHKQPKKKLTESKKRGLKEMKLSDVQNHLQYGDEVIMTPKGEGGSGWKELKGKKGIVKQIIWQPRNAGGTLLVVDVDGTEWNCSPGDVTLPKDVIQSRRDEDEARRKEARRQFYANHFDRQDESLKEDTSSSGKMYKHFDTGEIFSLDEIRQAYEDFKYELPQYDSFEDYLDYLLQLGRNREGGLIELDESLKRRLKEGFVKLNDEPIEIDYIETDDIGYVPMFKWDGKRYNLNDFIRCHNNPWGEIDCPDYIHAYDSTNYYNPIFIGLDDSGEYLDVYEQSEMDESYKRRLKESDDIQAYTRKDGKWIKGIISPKYKFTVKDEYIDNIFGNSDPDYIEKCQKYGMPIQDVKHLAREWGMDTISKMFNMEIDESCKKVNKRGLKESYDDKETMIAMLDDFANSYSYIRDHWYEFQDTLDDTAWDDFGNCSYPFFKNSFDELMLDSWAYDAKSALQNQDLN